MIREDLVPPELDERLREWADYFRDYRGPGVRCLSIESRYKRHSEDLGDEVSEEVRETPKRPKAPGWVLKAIETHEAIAQLDKQYKWALTYAYCYPSLPRFVVLRLMKKYTGRQLAWRRFLDLVDIGRIRVWTLTTTYSHKKS